MQYPQYYIEISEKRCNVPFLNINFLRRLLQSLHSRTQYSSKVHSIQKWRKPKYPAVWIYRNRGISYYATTRWNEAKIRYSPFWRLWEIKENFNRLRKTETNNTKVVANEKRYLFLKKKCIGITTTEWPLQYNCNSHQDSYQHFLRNYNDPSSEVFFLIIGGYTTVIRS